MSGRRRPSGSGWAAYLVVPFAGADATRLTDHIDRLREIVRAHSGLTAHLTDLSSAVAGIDLVLVPVTGAMITVILVVVYRSPRRPRRPGGCAC